MTTNEIVGDIVQIFLTGENELSSLGLNGSVFFLMVVGLDEVGIWVEHPSYVIVKANDENGKPLPEDKREHNKLDANFLVRWDQIGTIVHFPNREGFDFPSPYEKHIGFVADDAREAEE